MRAISQYTWSHPTPDTWIHNLAYFPELYNGCFLTSDSRGGLTLYSLQQLSNEPILSIPKAHESSINSIVKIDETTVASVSTDGAKVWDISKPNVTSPLYTFNNTKNCNFLSVAYSPQANLLAAGSELIGVDSELHIWDLGKKGELVRSFVDSHHDDITDIKFHPTNPRYLMSGSTDGYVNVYDLNESDEDEALHQVINFASIHSCHFIRENRIAALSHMETLSIYELNNTNYEKVEEPAPNDLGDVRQAWPDCEYVVNINPAGFVSFGANSAGKLTLLPFDPIREEVDLTKPAWFPEAHGEEVVRDVLVIPGTQKALTCGEDGTVKAWELPFVPVEVGSEFSTNKRAAEDMEVLTGSDDSGKRTKKEKRDKKEKREKRDKDKRERSDKKDKKDRKDRKDKDKHSKGKKSKSDKKKKDVRFKPY